MEKYICTVCDGYMTPLSVILIMVLNPEHRSPTFQMIGFARFAV